MTSNEKKLREVIRKYIVGELNQQNSKTTTDKSSELDLGKRNLMEDEEYQKFFQTALQKFGVDSPDKLADDKKKEFFDYIDKNWKGKSEVDETSASGNAGSYMTPNAFTKPGQDYEGSPAAKAMRGWKATKRIDEAKEKYSVYDKKTFKIIRNNLTKDAAIKMTSKNKNYEYGSAAWVEDQYKEKFKESVKEQVDFKDENFSPKQKMAQAIRTVRESLKEVEKMVDKSRVFKEENDIKSVDMYKRSHSALKKIGEQLNRISNKMQTIK